jgi:hypothetical protein
MRLRLDTITGPGPASGAVCLPDTRGIQGPRLPSRFPGVPNEARGTRAVRNGSRGQATAPLARQPPSPEVLSCLEMVFVHTNVCVPLREMHAQVKPRSAAVAVRANPFAHAVL